ILDLSKVEAGKLQLDPQEVDLEKLLADSLFMFKEKAMKHRLQMKTAFENLPERIQADERSLKQILYNLLSNAVKFTPDGGQISLRAIKTASFNNGQRRAAVEISVTDSGIGITPEELGRIFKPFEQAETSSSRRYQGTGLGLSLTKHLIELHGGKIWATSGGTGKGSAFHFILPIQSGLLGPKQPSVSHESAPSHDPRLPA
ncbi:MAG: hypothetical protein JSW39_10765, partial [Desulfobacterales bacterium]